MGRWTKFLEEFVHDGLCFLFLQPISWNLTTNRWQTGLSCVLLLSNIEMYVLYLCTCLFLLPDWKLLKEELLSCSTLRLYYGDKYYEVQFLVNMKGKNLTWSNHPWKSLRNRDNLEIIFIKCNIKFPLVLEIVNVSLHLLSVWSFSVYCFFVDH